MIRGKQLRLFALLAGALLIPAVPGFSQAPAKQKPPAQAPAQETDQEYTEEEYDAYEKAANEKDLDKRGPMLFAFMEKYPKSKLMPHIETATQTLLYELQKAKKWNTLIAMAERWEKLHPNDLQTLAYITEASHNLGQDKKFLDYALKIYAQKPSPNLAVAIYESYHKLNDQAKYLEWAEKLFAYPEFAGEYELRMLFVQKYMEEKNFAKAASYATLAVKSVEAAKKPDGMTDAEWSKKVAAVRRSSYYISGLNFYEKAKYQDAIRSLETSLKYERSDGAYYYMGLSLWRLNMVEEAIDAFAKAVVLNKETRDQAKEHLEKLYKGLHNGTTIGIEKTYRRAKTDLGLPVN
jgi:tetratricopeptide (TPR) repeat protein